MLKLDVEKETKPGIIYVNSSVKRLAIHLMVIFQAPDGKFHLLKSVEQ